jgi:type IV pilus assembly protein PilM
MLFSGLFGKKNAILGVDIGTSNIKIAQISHDQRPVLDTYGIVNAGFLLTNKNQDSAIEKTAQALKSLIGKSGVNTKRCVISFPNSAVFTSVVTLPKMSSKDLASSVEFEAKKYVPLPLNEVDLSWSVIEEASNTSDASNQQILLTAVPKQVTENYLKVFEMVGLSPEVGEIETLSLIRSLIGNLAINCVIIDIGSKSTGLNIIEKGFLRLSRNLNIGGDTITVKISQSLNISLQRAEQFKRDFGISGNTFIPEVVKPVLDLIKNEVKQLLTIYQSHSVKVDKIILVGGGANLPGIVEYFKDLQVSVEMGDPLKTIAYKESLKPVLQRYALSLPIAIGLALRNE